MIEEKQGHSVKIHPLELQSLSSLSLLPAETESLEKHLAFFSALKLNLDLGILHEKVGHVWSEDPIRGIWFHWRLMFCLASSLKCT